MENKMIVNGKNQKIVLNKIAGLANWFETMVLIWHGNFWNCKIKSIELCFHFDDQTKDYLRINEWLVIHI